jgi:hypothetical protein
MDAAECWKPQRDNMLLQNPVQNMHEQRYSAIAMHRGHANESYRGRYVCEVSMWPHVVDVSQNVGFPALGRGMHALFLRA